MVGKWSQRLLALCAVTVFVAASPSFAQAVSYTATLSGANEVPANASVNTGLTVVTVNPITGVVTWNTTSSIANAATTGHHIHRGAVGVNGPVVINFGVYSGTVTVTPALAAEIVGNPTNFYVNVHTALFPGGEIRGPLAAVPVTTSVPVLGLPLLALLGVVLAGFAAVVFRRSKQG